MEKQSIHKVKLQNVREIAISDDYICLDALLKFASIVSSGGEAKMLIQNEEVYLGGKICAMRKKKVKPGDVVRYDREILIVRKA